jgi:hypothetical protein
MQREAPHPGRIQNHQLEYYKHKGGKEMDGWRDIAIGSELGEVIGK